MDTVWVLRWEYLDKSASGVLRAYASEGRAQLDLDLLEAEQGDKKYEIEALPVYS